MTAPAHTSPRAPFAQSNSSDENQSGPSPPSGAASSASDKLSDSLRKPSRFAESGAHFLAGCIGSMTAATATAPLDVLRTRFQSDYYKQQLIETRIARGITDIKTLPFYRGAALHFRETFQVLFAIPRTEGWRGLFKGLPAQLIGTVPARGIHFFMYGTCKRIYSETFNGGHEGPIVHVASAASAVATTAFATNPIWVVKTRLQLDHEGKTLTGETAKARQYKNALDCAKQVLQKEGVAGMYRGLSGSLLGISESATQWTLYEYGKKKLNARRDAIEDGLKEKNWADSILGPFGDSVIAGGSKFLASLLTYPHEVVRTRLRQVPGPDGVRKYTGLIQTFRLIIKQEGLTGLYGGLIPHMMRVVPNAAIMFGTYEFVLKTLLGETRKQRNSPS